MYTSGKTFGGGSARNSLNYQRSSAGAFQKWADEVGDQSYTFDNLLPFFKRSVRFSPPNTATTPSNVFIPTTQLTFPALEVLSRYPSPATLTLLRPGSVKHLASWGFEGFLDSSMAVSLDGLISPTRSIPPVRLDHRPRLPSYARPYGRRPTSTSSKQHSQRKFSYRTVRLPLGLLSAPLGSSIPFPPGRKSSYLQAPFAPHSSLWSLASGPPPH